MGNLFSVKRACEHVGLHPVVTSDVSVIKNCDAMILPGVGAFGDAMSSLNRRDLTSPVKDFIQDGRPFMGICLGMQILMSESEEFGNHKGLDIIRGAVVKFPTKRERRSAIKVPQVGWNNIYRPATACNEFWMNTPFRGVRNREFMYFIHSFYAVPEDPSVVLSYTDYEGIEYSSSIYMNNVLACQFHPEKSSVEGMKIYENFASLVKNQKENHEH